MKPSLLVTGLLLFSVFGASFVRVATVTHDRLDNYDLDESEIVIESFTATDTNQSTPWMFMSDLWVYNVTRNLETYELDVNITKIEIYDEELTFVVQYDNPQNTTQFRLAYSDWELKEELWLSKTTGVKNHTVYTNGTAKIMDFPVQVGKTWAWNVSFSNTVTWPNSTETVTNGTLTDIEYKVVAVENITVPGGTFETYRIGRWEDSVLTSTSWFSHQTKWDVQASASASYSRKLLHYDITSVESLNLSVLEDPKYDYYKYAKCVGNEWIGIQPFAVHNFTVTSNETEYEGTLISLRSADNESMLVASRGFPPSSLFPPTSMNDYPFFGQSISMIVHNRSEGSLTLLHKDTLYGDFNGRLKLTNETLLLLTPECNISICHVGAQRDPLEQRQENLRKILRQQGLDAEFIEAIMGALNSTSDDNEEGVGLRLGALKFLAEQLEKALETLNRDFGPPPFTRTKGPPGGLDYVGQGFNISVIWRPRQEGWGWIEWMWKDVTSYIYSIENTDTEKNITDFKIHTNSDARNIVKLQEVEDNECDDVTENWEIKYDGKIATIEAKEDKFGIKPHESFDFVIFGPKSGSGLVNVTASWDVGPDSPPIRVRGPVASVGSPEGKNLTLVAPLTIHSAEEFSVQVLSDGAAVWEPTSTPALLCQEISGAVVLAYTTTNITLGITDQYGTVNFTAPMVGEMTELTLAVHKPLYGKYDFENGWYPEISVVRLMPRVIAIPYLTASETMIDVTVRNQGCHTETTNITVSYIFEYDPLVGSQNVILESGESTTLTFEWTPQTNLIGSYIITAEASAVPGEVDTTNNIKTIAHTFARTCLGSRGPSHGASGFLVEK